MLTPSSITPSPRSFAFPFFVERSEILHDTATDDSSFLEIVVEHAAHQALRLSRRFRVRIVLRRERDQRCAAHDRPPRMRLRRAPRATIVRVMVAFSSV